MATLKGKKMLPMGSIFFPLIVALFKTLKHTLLSKKCPFIAHCVTEFETVFCGLLFSNWHFLF